MTERFLAMLKGWPQAAVDVTYFTSGASDISVSVGREVIVIQCWPAGGIGISLLSEEDEEFTGFKHVFDDLPSALGYLTSLLDRIVQADPPILLA